MEERRLRGDPIMSYDFLNLLDYVESEQFLKRYINGTTRSHSMKSSKYFARKDVNNRYFNSLKVVDETNKLSYDMANVDSIHKEVCKVV